MTIRDAILAAVRANQPPLAPPIPVIPLFERTSPPLLEQFQETLMSMGGKFVPALDGEGLDALARSLFPDAAVICSATSEVRSTRALDSNADPADLADVDVGVVRAAFGVAETGSVWLSEEELKVNALDRNGYRQTMCCPSFPEFPDEIGKVIGLYPSALVPDYLTTHYWWAYIHPKAVKLFERQWLVNLILWGNYARLRDAALAELGESLSGKTLQVACAYGDLTNCLSQRATIGGGSIDIVDVLPIQLKNLRNKLPAGAPARLLAMDAMDLKLPDASYDRALVFFLLHEQPREWRERTLSEVLRVVKPGGKVIIVDYARPRWWHPLRYLFPILLAKFEPFALDLWREEITSWLPGSCTTGAHKCLFFGGLYQLVVSRR